MITNAQLAEYPFLEDMYGDDYYPDHLVDQCKAILTTLCTQIEAAPPADLDGLYVLTHAATESFNGLQAAFSAADSDIETVARETIAEDFAVIAEAYGFEDADIEELISPRDW
ncbi:DUF5713 family protein [Leucobacter sp. 1207-22]|uniref:DUF5713 family protein n=1 Tax=Leucobacter sp. 1207-22 TaxID=2604456 RepID=UPI004063AF62